MQVLIEERTSAPVFVGGQLVFLIGEILFRIAVIGAGSIPRSPPSYSWLT